MLEVRQKSVAQTLEWPHKLVVSVFLEAIISLEYTTTQVSAYIVYPKAFFLSFIATCNSSYMCIYADAITFNENKPFSKGRVISKRHKINPVAQPEASFGLQTFPNQ